MEEETLSRANREVDRPATVASPAPSIVTVVWDDQNPDWDFKSRTLSEDLATRNPPAVNRFYPMMKDKAGDFRVNLEKPFDWRRAIIDLNDGDIRKFDYLVGPARAQYNTTGWPMQAYLVMSGNKLQGQKEGDWFRFETLQPSDLPKAAGMTIQTHPHFVHRFTCVGWDGKTKRTKRIESTGTPRGDVFYFLVTKEGIGYIPLRHVVFE